MRTAQEAIRAIEAGNNGYADIGNRPEVIEAVRAAGYCVILTHNIHGVPTHRGFTKRAQQALAVEPFGRSTYAAPRQQLDTPDFEGAILARDARHHL